MTCLKNTVIIFVCFWPSVVCYGSEIDTYIKEYEKLITHILMANDLNTEQVSSDVNESARLTGKIRSLIRDNKAARIELVHWLEQRVTNRSSDSYSGIANEIVREDAKYRPFERLMDLLLEADANSYYVVERKLLDNDNTTKRAKGIILKRLLNSDRVWYVIRDPSSLKAYDQKIRPLAQHWIQNNIGGPSVLSGYQTDILPSILGSNIGGIKIPPLDYDLAIKELKVVVSDGNRPLNNKIWYLQQLADRGELDWDRWGDQLSSYVKDDSHFVGFRLQCAKMLYKSGRMKKAEVDSLKQKYKEKESRGKTKYQTIIPADANNSTYFPHK